MHRARATFVRDGQRNDTYSIDFIHEYHEYRDGECNKLVNEATIPGAGSQDPHCIPVIR